MTGQGVVIVTGGGGAIGAAIARCFAQSGAAAVAVCDRALDKATDVANDIGPAGHAFEIDVTDRDAVAATFRKIEKAHGPVQTVVLGAGIAVKKSVLDYTAQDWQRTLDVNLTGAFYCAQEAAKSMVASRVVNASIIAISSICGATADPYSQHVAYEASKGGLNMMVRAMAVELGPMGIRVNAVAPGRIDTPLVNPDLAHRAGVMPRIPLGRYGQPAEVANLVYFLSSPQAEYLTGTIVNTDGGWGAQ